MGSPNMTLDPNHVEYKMEEDLKTKREAAKANLQPVFAQHHQEVALAPFSGNGWECFPPPPSLQALPQPVSTPDGLTRPPWPVPPPAPVPLPVPPPTHASAVVTPFDCHIPGSCVAAKSKDGGARAPAPVFRDGASFTSEILDVTKVKETTAWLRNEKKREEELRRPPVNVNAMLHRILKEENEPGTSR